MKCTSLGQYVRWKVEEIAVRRSFDKSGLNKPDGTPKRDFPQDYLDGFKGDESEFLALLSPEQAKIVKRHKIPMYDIPKPYVEVIGRFKPDEEKTLKALGFKPTV